MRKKNREISIFSLSFLDVFANTIGGLAFLLILAVMMISGIVFTPPRILTERLPDAHHGRPYQFWLAAREGLGQFRWSLAEGTLPPGLRLDPESGSILGTPELPTTDGEGRAFEFEVLCTVDQETAKTPLEDRRRYQLHLSRRQPVETTPLRLITERVLPPAFLDKPYPLAFAAEGGQAPYRWSGQPPAGLTLTPEGRLGGAPTRTGSFDFPVMVVTPQGERQSGTFSLAVSEQHPPPPPVPPLVVRTETLPPALAERGYGLQLAAEGGTPPYTWSLGTGAPPWLNLSGRGDLTGTARLAQVGTVQLTVEVRDREDRLARSQSLTLEVLPPVPDQPPPLVLRTRSLPEARAGHPYEVALAAEGGFPPYAWSADGPEEASGLAFDAAAGTLVGLPRQVGSVPLRVTVSDRAGQRTSRDLPLVVRPPVAPIKILTAALPEARAGRLYHLALSAVGGYPPYQWRSVAGTLPPGLELDALTGALQGAPEQAGTWEISLTAVDAEGQAAASPLVARLVVLTAQGFRPLRITTRALPPLLAGRRSDLTLAATGGEAPYRWRLVSGSLPAGLTLEDGRIVDRATAAGDFPLKLAVEDASGLGAEAALTLSTRWMIPLWIAALLAMLVVLLAGLAFLLWRRVRRSATQPLSITTRSLPNARASFDYAVQLASAGGVPPYHWRLPEGEALPPGLTLETDGLLHGKPFEGIGLDTTREMPFTVEVKDGRGETARQEL